MLKKVMLFLAIFALVAVAGTLPSGAHYTVTLNRPSVVQGTALKAGDYRLSLGDSKVTITDANGKNVVEAPVKIESQGTKYSDTIVRFSMQDGKAVIAEIRLGGTKTRVVFNQ